MPEVAVSELWRHSEQRGYYTKLQQGSNLVLHELGLDHIENFGEPDAPPQLHTAQLPVKFSKALRDATVAWDCVELFAGCGDCASRGLNVHPGVERSAVGRGYGDMSINDTFRDLAKLAASGAVREWHAAPPCWSFGTLRRPRLRSKEKPAGFDPTDPKTLEQTMLAVRTAFLLFLALTSGSYISCEQPGRSVMFQLHIFQRLLESGCTVTKFCFCAFGSGFQKPSKWLHNKPWLTALGGTCTCEYKGRRFTIEGSFTRASIGDFNKRCKPSTFEVYGRDPRPGEAVSSFSASYPIPLCEAMANGSRAAHRQAARGVQSALVSTCPDADDDDATIWTRPWFDDPEWVEDICEGKRFHEVFRYRFKRSGHINCVECRVYKSWLKHSSKVHAKKRLVGFLDIRVTMGAAAKGRSSSKALSRILRSTVPYILGSCLYPGSLHCRSQWNRADAPSRGADVTGPSRPVPPWLQAFQEGDFELFDLMVTSSTWVRPIGRWFRLLLLLAGDVERNPGPSKAQEYIARGVLNLLVGFARATSVRMSKCLKAFKEWSRREAHLSMSQVLDSAETANLALKVYGLALCRKGAPRYWLVYAIAAVQRMRPEFWRCLSEAWQVDRKWQQEELPLVSPLVPASVTAFRRQWNSILDKLQTLRRQAEGGATPGTLRGPGATHEYLQSTDISRIQWRGRWTLEHSIQEAAAQLSLHNLYVTSRRQLLFLEAHLHFCYSTSFLPVNIRLGAVCKYLLDAMQKGEVGSQLA